MELISCGVGIAGYYSLDVKDTQEAYVFDHLVPYDYDCFRGYGGFRTGVSQEELSH